MAVDTKAPAVFLDKDGTLVHDARQDVDPGRTIWYADTASALRRLQQAGYLLIITTNQSGIAFGLFDESALCALFAHLTQQLDIWGVRLTSMLYCPHHPAGSVSAYTIVCECRKPRPGMLHSAARTHRIQLADSWMVGDILDDVEAGNRAGCRSILLDRGNETVWKSGPYRTPNFRAQSLTEAVGYILESDYV